MDHLRGSGRRSHHPTPIAGKHTPSLSTHSKVENPHTSPSFIISKPRSASTTRSRSSYSDSNQNNIMIHHAYPMTINTRLTSPVSKKKPTHDNGGTNIFPRRKPTSPSAWALSPGRVAPFQSPAPPVKPPSPGGRTSGARGGGGGISGVLKYFRSKKTSTEDLDRRFILMNNRLLQWRFANARAQATMSNSRARTQKKMFNTWLEILAIRNSNTVKRMEVARLKHDIKLYHIMNSQLFLLEKWSRMEAKNYEAVGRVVRKLSVVSINIPLLHDSKGDISDVCDVLDIAATILEDIESAISKLSHEAEKSCYMLTELSIIAKEETELLTELQTWMSDVSLKEKERSLQGHLIQAN